MGCDNPWHQGNEQDEMIMLRAATKLTNGDEAESRSKIPELMSRDP